MKKMKISEVKLTPAQKKVLLNAYAITNHLETIMVNEDSNCVCGDEGCFLIKEELLDTFAEMIFELVGNEEFSHYDPIEGLKAIDD